MDNQITKDLEFIKDFLLAALQETANITEAAMNLWFSHMQIRSIKDSVVYIVVESDFKREQIENKYKNIITSYLSEILGYSVTVSFGVDESLAPPLQGKSFIKPFDPERINLPDEKESDSVLEEDDPEEEEPKYQTTSGHGERRLMYNPDYTFENFVVGESNQLAHSVAKYVAEHPAKKYNPLFIYGPPGVGKTHLMYAITNKILLDNPDANITYIKGEEFTNRLVEAINKGKQVQFREKYRKVDILLIDDVQFIAGKNSSQEELFHTFNTLYEEHKQIILTSDRPPKEMLGLEERIKSRFEGGMMADIQLPDYELRLAVLRNKARSTGLELSNEVEVYLADNLSSNIRQIEGVIKKLSGIAFLSEEPLTVETVRRKVPEYLSENVPVEDTVKKIIKVCADYYSVTEDEVLGEKRDKNIRLARNASMYLIKELTELSYPNIGDYFGKKHSTVISNCKTVRETLESDPTYAAELEEMKREIKR